MLNIWLNASRFSQVFYHYTWSYIIVILVTIKDGVKKVVNSGFYARFGYIPGIMRCYGNRGYKLNLFHINQGIAKQRIMIIKQ